VSVRLGLGIATLPFESPRGFFRWASLCEAGGVDSLWQTDRLLTREPYLEAMSAMAALAGATERIKFGMNAVTVTLRDPLVLARQCATIDHLSGGRLLPVFGVGAAQAPEWSATGRDPAGRGGRANEALALMARLWAEDEVHFRGRHFRYEGVSIAPRPVQRPLPLWIGGHSPAAIRRTARLGTGWLAGLATPAQVRPVIASIREELRAVGRSVGADHYGATLPFRFGAWDDSIVQRMARARAALPEAPDPRAWLAVGDASALLARVREYVDAGVSKFVMIPLAEGEADVFAQTERLIAEVLPAAEALAPRSAATPPGVAVA
jgi:probable F420-dependent oxidoreductase